MRELKPNEYAQLQKLAKEISLSEFHKKHPLREIDFANINLSIKGCAELGFASARLEYENKYGGNYEE